VLAQAAAEAKKARRNRLMAVMFFFMAVGRFCQSLGQDRPDVSPHSINSSEKPMNRELAASSCLPDPRTPKKRRGIRRCRVDEFEKPGLATD
jgi:hypothetical protein